MKAMLVRGRRRAAAAAVRKLLHLLRSLVSNITLMYAFSRGNKSHPALLTPCLSVNNATL